MGLSYSRVVRGSFKNNPTRERGCRNSQHEIALAHASGYFRGFETASS